MNRHAHDLGVHEKKIPSPFFLRSQAGGAQGGGVL